MLTNASQNANVNVSASGGVGVNILYITLNRFYDDLKNR